MTEGSMVRELYNEGNLRIVTAMDGDALPATTLGSCILKFCLKSDGVWQNLLQTVAHSEEQQHFAYFQGIRGRKAEELFVRTFEGALDAVRIDESQEKAKTFIRKLSQVVFKDLVAQAKRNNSNMQDVYLILHQLTNRMMTEAPEIGTKWVPKCKIDLVRALLHISKDLPADLPEVVRYCVSLTPPLLDLNDELLWLLHETLALADAEDAALLGRKTPSDEAKRLSVPGLEGLARLLELLTNYFKVEMGHKLFDCFHFVADPQMLQASSRSPLGENEGITKLVRLANIFHLLPTAANIFLNNLVDAIVQKEAQMHFSSQKYPDEGVQFFIDNLHLPRHLRTLRSILQAQLAPNAQRVLASHTNTILAIGIHSNNCIIPALLLFADLAELDHCWILDHANVMESLLALWDTGISMQQPERETALCHYILDLLKSWCLVKWEIYPTMKEKASLLLKMVHFEHKSDSLFNTFLELVYEIYTEPSLRRSNLTARLEPLFFVGCCSTDFSLRECFLDLLDVSVPRSLFSRLMYIYAVQSWESVADHNWLHITLHLFLGAA
ncbi:hypothetical protein C8R42DRAFT_639039 [Lentinula raphanica]|nr:hypothetical protein C8R42DRAFT_639039 [Lentinula raphanica]